MELFWDENKKSASGKFIPIERETKEPHSCSIRTSNCNLCGMELIWDKSLRSDTGKIRPAEAETGESHYCPERTFNCKTCGKELIWNKSLRSDTDKLIPAEKETNEAHYCPNKGPWKCGNCGAEYVWARAPNGKSRPHSGGKIHDCLGRWDNQGNDIPQPDAWDIADMQEKEGKEQDSDDDMPNDDGGADQYTEEGDDAPDDDYRGDTNRPGEVFSKDD